MTKKKDPSQLKPKGRKPSPKSTAVEVQVRVNKVFDLLIQGASRQQIFQYAAGIEPKGQKDGSYSEGRPAWGVSERMIDEYIARANELFSEYSKIHADRETGKAITRYNQLYTLALKKGDLKAALSAQQALCALLGLNAPAKLAHEGKDGAKEVEVKATLNISEEVRKIVGVLPDIKL